MNLLLNKEQRDKLYQEVSALDAELKVANDDIDYYKELLRKTRTQMIEIYNASGAKTFPLDNETPDEAWERLANSILEKLNA